MELFKRQYDPYDDYPYASDSWWWSTTGIAVRYSITIVILLLFFIYFGGGYLHARRRLRQGRQPLKGTAWMVRRQMYYAAQNPYTYNGQQPPAGASNDAFGGAVPRHAMPPPAYNADQAPPPVYPSGQEPNKIAADQHYTQATYREGESSVNMPAQAAAPAATSREI